MGGCGGSFLDLMPEWSLDIGPRVTWARVV